ncbi:MAG: S26 family signal peptidase [Firmicutes bacterium]|nr:S26 family signal peptidase [Bacillota bacterium]
MEDKQGAYAEQKKIIRRLRRNCLIRIALFGAAIVFFFTCVAGIGSIRSDAMAPALHTGDLVLFLRDTSPSCGETILYGTGQGQQAGLVMADSTRAGESEGASDSCQKEVITVLTDHRLEGEDPRRYQVISKDLVHGTVLAVLRRGK